MRRWLPILWTIFLPVLLLWPLPRLGTTEVLAAPDQEAATHIWGLWAAGQSEGFFGIEGTMARFPENISLHLVDPAHQAIYQLGALHGPALGYNLILLQGFWVLGLAGWLLAGHVGATRWIGATIAMLGAPMLAAPASGMTETMGAGWVGIQLVMLLRWLGTGNYRFGMLTVLTFGCAAWSGPYNAVWAAMTNLVVCIGWWFRTRGPSAPWNTRLRPLWVGIGSVCCVFPLFEILGSDRAAQLPGTAERSGAILIHEQPDIFRGGILNGADLSDPFLPVWLTGGEASVSHTTYLGVVALMLAGAAALRTSELRLWLAGAAGMVLLAFGPHWHLGGEILSSNGEPVLAPAGWLMQFSPFDRLTHWYRAGAIAHLLMVPVVAVQLTRLRMSRRILCGVAILLDTLFWAPLQWPLHHSAIPDATPLVSLPDDRALIEIPPVSSGQPPPNQWRDLGPLLQTLHGHPTGGSPMRLGVSNTACSAQRSIEHLLREGSTDESALQTAMDDGFGWLVIYPDYRPMPETARQNLNRCLGSPFHQDDGVWIYRLKREIPSDCLRSQPLPDTRCPSHQLTAPN